MANIELAVLFAEILVILAGFFIFYEVLYGKY